MYYRFRSPAFFFWREITVRQLGIESGVLIPQVTQVQNMSIGEHRSLPADVLWGSFVTHSFNECVTNGDKRTPKDVCGEATNIGIVA